MSKILLFEAIKLMAFFFFSSRRRHTRWNCHWSSDVCSSDLALGASKWRTISSVVVPAASRGILTAILLAVARVAGETAPLLFTAFGNRFWSPGWGQPTASLPVVIFTYAVSPYEDWHRQAWAAGLVLLGLILAVNIVARVVLARGVRVPRS